MKEKKRANLKPDLAPQPDRNAWGFRVAGRFEPGTPPKGGFQGIWSFNDTGDCRNSPTSKPETQNRITRDGK